MSRVTELGYLGISVSDAEAWKRYATEIIGFELVDEGERDRFYLRADGWHHRIVVHADGGDDCVYAGWRVAGRPELDALAKRLSEAGVDFRWADRAEAEERYVLGLIKLKDPGGNPVEIFYGPQVDGHKPFHPGRPMFGRFQTGDKGMGHVILAQPDVQAAIEFYERLGFVGEVEYRVSLPGGMVVEPVFMHLNARQHSLAFGIAGTDKRINHLMIEYSDIKDLGIAHDLTLKRQIPMPMTLGMHANDEVLSFYLANPSKWMFELGWGGRAAPAQQEYFRQDIFGHANAATGFGVDFDASETG